MDPSSRFSHVALLSRFCFERLDASANRRVFSTHHQSYHFCTVQPGRRQPRNSPHLRERLRERLSNPQEIGIAARYQEETALWQQILRDGAEK